MTSADYRQHLIDLADQCFVAKNSVWNHKRSKRSRELNKAAIRLNDAELAEFRQMTPDDELMTKPAYDLRSIISGITQRS